jgi:hypothetical protein
MRAFNAERVVAPAMRRFYGAAAGVYGKLGAEEFAQ